MPQLQKQVDIAGHFAGLNFKQVPAAIQQPVGMLLQHLSHIRHAY